DQGIALWDLTARQCLSTLPSRGKIASIAFSPAGELLAWATSCGLLEVRSRKEPRHVVRRESWPRDHAAPAHVVFSPDGKWIGTTYCNNGSRSVVFPYDGVHVLLVPVSQRPVDTSPVFGLAPDGYGLLSQLAFSPDGSRLAVGSFDRTILIFNPKARYRVMQLHQGQKVHYVAFSPDGKTLAAGNPRGLVKLWDAATGRKLLTLKGQAKPLRALSYSPDGKVLVTAGGEGIVTFWDVQTGRSRTAFDWGIGEVLSVCF